MAKNDIIAVSVLTGITMLIGMIEGASAAPLTETQEQTFSLSKTLPEQPNLPETFFQIYSASASLEFASFDTQGGTRQLTGIAYSLLDSSNAISGQVTYREFGFGSASINGSNQATFTIGLAGTGTGDDGTLQQFSLMTIGGSSNGSLTLSDSGAPSLAQSGALFADSGTFNVTFALEAEIAGTVTAFDAFISTSGVSGSWSGRFVVEYTYELVDTGNHIPEAGTLAILGAGLAGLGVARWRRRRG